MTALSISELARRLDNLIRPGLIEEVSAAAGRVRVRSGGLLSGWIPWLTHRAGGDRDWWAPEVGEQVLVLAPGGEPAAGIALPAIYQTAAPAPADRIGIRVIRFSDGCEISYDRDSHHLIVNLPGDGTAEITAAGGITLNGPVTINGDITHNGRQQTSDDVVADGISLKGHKHGKVTPGGGKTDVPE